MSKGTIKNENKISIPGIDVVQLDLFAKNLITKMTLIARVTNTSEEEINLVITVTQVYSPKNGSNTVHHGASEVMARVDIADKYLADVLAQNRAQLWFFNDLLKTTWVIRGTIGASSQQMVIAYFEDIKRACYSLKSMEEIAGAINQNPQAN